MSSSSSPIELAILSVKPQDSHVQHAASHVYAVKDGIYCSYLKCVCSSKEKYYKSQDEYLGN